MVHAAIADLAARLSMESWSRSTESVRGMLEHVRALRADLEAHVAQMDGPEGMFHCIAMHAPRLSRQVEQIACEHACLGEDLARLQDRLEAFDGADPADQRAVRLMARRFLDDARLHQSRGDQLVMEAYCTDIAAAD